MFRLIDANTTIPVSFHLRPKRDFLLLFLANKNSASTRRHLIKSFCQAPVVPKQCHKRSRHEIYFKQFLYGFRFSISPCSTQFISAPANQLVPNYSFRTFTISHWVPSLCWRAAWSVRSFLSACICSSVINSRHSKRPRHTSEFCSSVLLIFVYSSVTFLCSLLHH